MGNKIGPDNIANKITMTMEVESKINCIVIVKAQDVPIFLIFYSIKIMVTDLNNYIKFVGKPIEILQ